MPASDATDTCRAGFRAIADRAIAKLTGKDREVDIGIADLVLENLAAVPLFYTVNHPTAALQGMVARRILDRLGIPAAAPPPALLTPTKFSNRVVWPVDAVWAGIMGLGYATGRVFWHINYMMDLPEFIWRSYTLYRRGKALKLEAGLG